jgi:putative hydrolase of the HAD superfamily
VILFDLGGVLMYFAGFDEINALLPEPLAAGEIRSRWLQSEPVRDFELGRIGSHEFAERFISEWGIPLDRDDFLRAFAGWPRGFFAGVPELLRDLRTGYRLACLSNSNRLHWEAIRGSLNPHFESAFISCQLGLAKPDPAVFRTALKALAVEPSDVLFFDDAELNTRSAAELGLHAELVRGPTELRERLAELELIAG